MDNNNANRMAIAEHARHFIPHYHLNHPDSNVVPFVEFSDSLMRDRGVDIEQVARDGNFDDSRLLLQSLGVRLDLNGDLVIRQSNGFIGSHMAFMHANRIFPLPHGRQIRAPGSMSVIGGLPYLYQPPPYVIRGPPPPQIRRLFDDLNGNNVRSSSEAPTDPGPSNDTTPNNNWLGFDRRFLPVAVTRPQIIQSIPFNGNIDVLQPGRNIRMNSGRVFRLPSIPVFREDVPQSLALQIEALNQFNRMVRELFEEDERNARPNQ